MSEVLSWLVWPAIVALPLTLTQEFYPPLHYSQVFPRSWYEGQPPADGDWPSPLGLSLGIGAVVVGQLCMLLYFVYWARPAGLHRAAAASKDSDDKKKEPPSYVAIQKDGARPYDLREGLLTHLAQPEGFVMLGSYLVGTWMLGWMPRSYYSFAGGVNWLHVALQLLLQDGLQYVP